MLGRRVKSPIPAPGVAFLRTFPGTGYKKGSCLCYDGTEYVYVLQCYYGSFFKYHVETDTWSELQRYDYRNYLNRNGRKKKPKYGAALVYNNLYNGI